MTHCDNGLFLLCWLDVNLNMVGLNHSIPATVYVLGGIARNVRVVQH